MASKSILIIAGTNRPDSNTLKVATVVAGLYHQAGATAEVLSLSEMPPEAFNPAAYATKPPAVVALQQRVLAAGGLHLITPEYNGSFPGVLKYFIDLLKFPESFEGKPVAYTGVAAGIWGGLRAVEQLQAIFGYRNAYGFPNRVFIAGIHGKLDAAGKISDADTLERLTGQATGFSAFVGKVGT
jgi:chromate reductase, NAD(P)H dehydrogenase (quinone)